MKASSRYITRALAALAAAAVIGLAGACKEKGGTEPVPVPPPPVPPAAPTNVIATAVSATQIDLAWTDASANEDGFKIESCSGADCTNFAAIGQVAANVVTFQNIGLTASTGYKYRVLAFNAVGNSTPSSTANGTTLAPPVGPGAILVGAGEITGCATQASMQTAALIEGVIAANPDAIVYTVGNNLADTTTPSRSYESCFDPKWGAFKPRMRAAVGQMDFASVGVSTVYSYFGDRAGAPNGWYSFDVGPSWHVIVLNTATWQHGAENLTDPTSPQNTWLAADLAANVKPCIMVISWERRIYTNGQGARGRQANMLGIGNMLYAAGVDVLVSAKDKLYARFPQTDAQGIKDEVGGFRQFIVGTGGRSPDALVTPAASADDPISPVEVQNNAWGVLKFTLDAASYKWEFLPTVAGGFTDTGTTACH